MHAAQVLAIVAQSLQCDNIAAVEQASQAFELTNIYPTMQEEHVDDVASEQVSHPVEQGAQILSDVT